MLLKEHFWPRQRLLTLFIRFKNASQSLTMVLWKPIHLRSFLAGQALIGRWAALAEQFLLSGQCKWAVTTGLERVCEQAVWKRRGGRGAAEEQTFMNFLGNKWVEDPTSRGRGSLAAWLREALAAFDLRSVGPWRCLGVITGVMAAKPLPNALPHMLRKSVFVQEPEDDILSCCPDSEEVLQLICGEEQLWLTPLQRPTAVKGSQHRTWKARQRGSRTPAWTRNTGQQLGWKEKRKSPGHPVTQSKCWLFLCWP